MNSLGQIEMQIAESTRNLKDLHVLREDMLKKYELRCGGCERPSALSEWTFRQAIWHVPPRGCTEGDYWKNDDPESRIVCPHCKKYFRIYDQDKNSQPFFLNARALMKKGEDFKI